MAKVGLGPNLAQKEEIRYGCFLFFFFFFFIENAEVSYSWDFISWKTVK